MSPVSSLLCVAQIMAPHGLQGHVKVKSFTENPAHLFTFPLVYDEQKQHSFQFEKKPSPLLKEKGQFIVRLVDVVSRTQVELLKGKKLFIERSMLPALMDDDAFYHADLIGLQVVDEEGNDLGQIQGVPHFGAGDLLEIVKQSVSIWIPFTQACVPEVNISGGFVRVDSTQIALFEAPQKQ